LLQFSERETILGKFEITVVPRDEMLPEKLSKRTNRGPVVEIHWNGLNWLQFVENEGNIVVFRPDTLAVEMELLGLRSVPEPGSTIEMTELSQAGGWINLYIRPISRLAHQDRGIPMVLSSMVMFELRVVYFQ
jgi:hypothetical protein